MAPTRAQLEAEPYWGREVRPPTLVGMLEQLRAHYGLGPSAVGIKGDVGHLGGGHRSPEWIYASRWSRMGPSDGSLILSTGARASSSNRDLRAADITPGAWGTPGNRRLMVAMTVSLDKAVRSGNVPQVRRFWGTKDGTTVYGWDHFYGRTTTSDTSHLDHLHVEMYPDRVNWDHGGVYTAITGTGDDMTPEQAQQLTNMHDWLYDFCRGLVAADPGTPHIRTYVPNQILAELRDRPGVVLPPMQPAPVDVAALAEQLVPHLEAAAEKAVRKVLGAVDGATPPG